MDDRERESLVEAARNARIAIHYADSTPEWQSDQKTVDAIAKRVEEVGESLRRVRPDRRSAISTSIPWSDAIGMREKMAHEHGTIDYDIMTEVVERDLPAVISAIETTVGEGDKPVE